MEAIIKVIPEEILGFAIPLILCKDLKSFYNSLVKLGTI